MDDEEMEKKKEWVRALRVLRAAKLKKQRRLQRDLGVVERELSALEEKIQRIEGGNEEK